MDHLTYLNSLLAAMSTLSLGKEWSLSSFSSCSVSKQRVKHVGIQQVNTVTAILMNGFRKLLDVWDIKTGIGDTNKTTGYMDKGGSV